MLTNMFIAVKDQMFTSFNDCVLAVSKINTNLSTASMIGGIVDFICEVAKYIGVVILVSGIFMFIMAYKDDNAESQSRAARFAVIGAVLLGLKTMLKLIGIIS